MKRSPIQRGIKRLRRITRLKSVGARKLREVGASRRFRELVLAAANHRCEYCRQAKADDPHHICPRGRGVGHPMLHDPRNGFAVCRACHEEIHSTPGHPWIETRAYLDLLEGASRDPRPK